MCMDDVYLTNINTYWMNEFRLIIFDMNTRMNKFGLPVCYFFSSILGFIHPICFLASCFLILIFTYNFLLSVENFTSGVFLNLVLLWSSSPRSWAVPRVLWIVPRLIYQGCPSCFCGSIADRIFLCHLTIQTCSLEIFAISFMKLELGSALSFVTFPPGFLISRVLMLEIGSSISRCVWHIYHITDPPFGQRMSYSEDKPSFISNACAWLELELQFLSPRDRLPSVIYKLCLSAMRAGEKEKRERGREEQKERERERDEMGKRGEGRKQEGENKKLGERQKQMHTERRLLCIVA